MYSKNHSLLYVSLFCVYPFLSRLDKSMMVPSLSPFPVLLKLKVVWGCYTAALFFLFFWTGICWEQILEKKNTCSIHKICFSGAYFIFHTVLLLQIICCEFCTFVVIVCREFCRDNRGLMLCFVKTAKRCSPTSEELHPPKKTKGTLKMVAVTSWSFGLTGHSSARPRFHWTDASAMSQNKIQTLAVVLIDSWQQSGWPLDSQVVRLLFYFFPQQQFL